MLIIFYILNEVIEINLCPGIHPLSSPLQAPQEIQAHQGYKLWFQRGIHQIGSINQILTRLPLFIQDTGMVSGNSIDVDYHSDSNAVNAEIK